MAASRSTSVKEIKIYPGLCIIINSRDEESIKRIINYPVRGIGKTNSSRKTSVFSNEHNITFWEVLERAREFGF